MIGAGWSGAVVARELTDIGYRVTVFEKDTAVGGHSRFDQIQGVYYEPGGPHIFHTSDAKVAAYVQEFGLTRPYKHRVLTAVYLNEDAENPTLLSWPPQIEELTPLSNWGVIEAELAALPDKPTGDDFESYVQSMMGRTLYEMFIREYTIKQWARDPSELSSRFAPKRVELRSDGYRRLFRDRWEFFPAQGYGEVIDRILEPAEVVFGTSVSISDLDDLADCHDAFVVTAPLDQFLGKAGELEWRGIEVRAKFVPNVGSEEYATEAYVINYPSRRHPFTRTVETKHASGQSIEGTVVCEEHPGSPAQHYPVHTVDGRFERINERMKSEITDHSPRPVFFAGRLANYTYVNMDQAVRGAMECATEVHLSI